MESGRSGGEAIKPLVGDPEEEGDTGLCIIPKKQGVYHIGHPNPKVQNQEYKPAWFENQ